MHRTSPTDRIIYFDGVCGLCNAFVDLLLRNDRKGRFLFAPLQGTTAQEHIPELALGELTTVVYQRSGQVLTKSTAAIRILRDLGGFGSMAVLALVLPTPWRDRLYDGVARGRYRWFGRKETCRLPGPEERARFLP